MKKLIMSFLFSGIALGYAQQNEINFLHQNINFSAAPRTNINSMSIKMWDNYGNGGPSTYGTVLEFYGLHGHQTGQLYFGGADNSKIRYREAFYNEFTWSDWITLLDSKNNLESSGNLMLNGAGPHYIVSGNLGIGVTIPAEKIEIDGFIKSGNISFGHNAANHNGPRNYSTIGVDNHASLLIGSNLFIENNAELKVAMDHGTLSGAGILIPGNGMNNQNSIQFHTNPSGNAIAGSAFSNLRMIVTAGGDVGIGTTTPKEKLSVNGKIRAKEIKVELANWPDYVFEEGYQKLSLAEIEQFIKHNKHLPGVPTAKQVEQEGVELGEMNKILLKKIEELTLLLIDKDKELKREKEENNARLNEIEKWIKNKK